MGNTRVGQREGITREDGREWAEKVGRGTKIRGR